eukprot:scaffold1026_cov409-Prasinococcus_capsulatus_cf.AAC.21
MGSIAGLRHLPEDEAAHDESDSLSAALSIEAWARPPGNASAPRFVEEQADSDDDVSAGTLQTELIHAGISLEPSSRGSAFPQEGRRTVASPKRPMHSLDPTQAEHRYPRTKEELLATLEAGWPTTSKMTESYTNLCPSTPRSAVHQRAVGDRKAGAEAPPLQRQPQREDCATVPPVIPRSTQDNSRLGQLIDENLRFLRSMTAPGKAATSPTSTHLMHAQEDGRSKQPWPSAWRRLLPSDRYSPCSIAGLTGMESVLQEQSHMLKALREHQQILCNRLLGERQRADAWYTKPCEWAVLMASADSVARTRFAPRPQGGRGGASRRSVQGEDTTACGQERVTSKTN